MIKNKLLWMTGGAQGSGVDSSASIFARACAYGGLYVFGKREYYSNIKGRHSYFQVRVEDQQIRSHVDAVNLLTTFDAETVARHAQEVVAEGGIVYDPSIVNTKLSGIPTLDEREASYIRKDLEDQGLGERLADVLEDARRRGVHLYPVPYTDLLTELSPQFGGASLSKLIKMVNIMAVAASFSLLKFDLDLLARAIRSVFKGKPKVAEMNVVAAKRTYEHAEQKFGDSFDYRLEKVKASESRLLLVGNQAVALGKLLGGGRFQTYYPITPAADESEYLEANEVLRTKTLQQIGDPQTEEASFLEGKGSILVVQTEDEIAAILMATGAALAGARAATCTSGPGFSLMMEGLGWAGMNEVPIVVTYYQRAGPSTGLPTRHEQGDLRFALHAGHGEFPRIILASGDLEECFYDAAKAFNYAEKYQLPVIHLIDKALANSTWTVNIFDPKRVSIDRGQLLSEGDLEKLVAEGNVYKRFKFTDSGISPRGLLGMKGGLFWNTGDEHDELGHITEDPAIRVRMMEKRMGKLEVADREIAVEERVNFFGERDAEVTILSWGSPKGAILEAMERLKQEGHRTNFIQVHVINPFPTSYISDLLKSAKKKVIVEMNYSAQLAGITKEKTGIDMDYYIVKYTGRPMSSDEVYEGLKGILLNKAPRRQVMTYGA